MMRLQIFDCIHGHIQKRIPFLTFDDGAGEGWWDGRLDGKRDGSLLGSAEGSIVGTDDGCVLGAGLEIELGTAE